jgi:hypothetical protein
VRTMEAYPESRMSVTRPNERDRPRNLGRHLVIAGFVVALELLKLLV